MLRARVTCSADPLARLAVVRCIGTFAGHEAVAEIIHALNGLDQAWTYDIIVDLERFEGRLAWSHIDAFASAWQAWAQGRDAGRATVFIVSHPVLAAQCLSARTLLEGRDIAAFERFFDGYAWIAERNKARA